MLIPLVDVAPAGVGLPDLHQLARHRAARFVHNASCHDDALPDRLARITGRQVGIKRVDGGAFSTWANEELKAIKHCNDMAKYVKDLRGEFERGAAVAIVQ